MVRDREKNEQSILCTYGQVCSAHLAGENHTRPFIIVCFQNTDRVSHYARTCKRDELDFLRQLDRLIAVSSLENRLWFCGEKPSTVR